MINRISPRPWRIAPFSPTAIVDADGNHIASAMGSNSQAKADAQYLVAAAGQYDPKKTMRPTEFAPVMDLIGDDLLNRRFQRARNITEETTAETNCFELMPADETPRYLVVERTSDSDIFYAYQCATMQIAVSEFQDSDTDDLTGGTIHDLDTDIAYEVFWERRVTAIAPVKSNDDADRITFIHEQGR